MGSPFPQLVISETRIEGLSVARDVNAFTKLDKDFRTRNGATFACFLKPSWPGISAPATGNRCDSGRSEEFDDLRLERSSCP